MKAVILAGGKGRRLEPYTTVLPKPLMPVGEYPVLEIILRLLKKYGFHDVYLAVGHLAGLIEAYLGNGERLGLNITYSIEEEPLGTVGPLKLIEKKLKDESFLVVNGDVLTDMNIREFFEFHKNSERTMSIAITERKVHIDYGIVKHDGVKIDNFEEKPTLTYWVSMGIYAMSPRVFGFIPEGKFDIPDLIHTLLREKEEIGVYPYRGYWLDIGREEDMRKAQENASNIKKLLSI